MMFFFNFNKKYSIYFEEKANTFKITLQSIAKLIPEVLSAVFEATRTILIAKLHKTIISYLNGYWQSNKVK